MVVTLFNQRLPILFVLAGLLMSSGAAAQTSDEDNAEATRGRTAKPASGPTPDLARVADLIVQQTNEFRRQQGRAPVNRNPKLTEAARYFADYLARTGKFSHTADGSRPADRARKHGYDYCVIAENIAYEYHSAGFTAEELAKKFVEGWKNSPGHRKNMLDPDVTETGVAVARSEDTGYYYAVQMFGRPKSQAIAFEITNDSSDTVEYKLGDQTFSLPPNYTRKHERCRPGPLSFPAPQEKSDAKGETKSFQPATGDRFVVRQTQGRLKIEKR
jgi:uncharacterized protein YkwD